MSKKYVYYRPIFDFGDGDALFLSGQIRKVELDRGLKLMKEKQGHIRFLKRDKEKVTKGYTRDIELIKKYGVLTK